MDPLITHCCYLIFARPGSKCCPNSLLGIMDGYDRKERKQEEGTRVYEPVTFIYVH